MNSHSNAESQPPDDKSRRSFLGVLLGLASAVVAALLAVPVVRYVLYPLTSASKSSGWSAAGAVSEVVAAPSPLSRTLHLRQQDGWREIESNPTIYLVKKGNTVQALSSVCPHLGCIVPWNAARNAFVCPCHGGVFDPDGGYRSGPPRRGMDSLETSVADGNVLVKYQTFRPDVPNKEVTG